MIEEDGTQLNIQSSPSVSSKKESVVTKRSARLRNKSAKIGKQFAHRDQEFVYFGDDEEKEWVDSESVSSEIAEVIGTNSVRPRSSSWSNSGGCAVVERRRSKTPIAISKTIGQPIYALNTQVKPISSVRKVSTSPKNTQARKVSKSRSKQHPKSASKADTKRNQVDYIAKQHKLTQRRIDILFQKQDYTTDEDYEVSFNPKITTKDKRAAIIYSADKLQRDIVSMNASDCNQESPFVIRLGDYGSDFESVADLSAGDATNHRPIPEQPGVLKPGYFRATSQS